MSLIKFISVEMPGLNSVSMSSYLWTMHMRNAFPCLQIRSLLDVLAYMPAATASSVNATFYKHQAPSNIALNTAPRKSVHEILMIEVCDDDSPEESSNMIGLETSLMIGMRF